MHFIEFCQSKGIFHEFLASMTPQHNGVVKMKNQTLQKMARVMLHAKSLHLYFWAEAVSTTCHLHNRIKLRPGAIHVFDCKCYILNDRDYHKKWDSKSYGGIFLGYSVNSKAFQVFNKQTKFVIKSINV